MVLSFKKGDKVIYPNHGIGVIEQIVERTLDGAARAFYSLRLLGNDSTVMVPTDNIAEVGLRAVASKKDVDHLFRILKDGSIDTYGDWKGRYQENSEKMRTGSIVEVAAVYKNLMLLSHQKALSYRERKMLDRARYLIVTEVAVASSTTEGDAEKKLDRAVSVSIKNVLSH